MITISGLVVLSVTAKRAAVEILSLPKSGSFAVKASHLGKSARTRARLIDAALFVFARQGLDAASINEITREAGIANGTFYLHFKDKEELAAVVAFSVVAEIVTDIEAAMAGIDDAVERISRGTRHFIHTAFGRIDWGWTFFRFFWTLPQLRREVAQYLRQDIELGVVQGVFTVTVDDFLVEMVGSLVNSALFAQMNGTVGSEAGSRAAELQLRLLGVDPDRAREVAWRPLD